MYFGLLTVVQMTDMAGNYFRIYGKSWLVNFFKVSGNVFASSLHGAMEIGFVG